MTEVIRLSPQDALPEQAGSVIAMRRFGEDDPRARLIVIEIVGGHAGKMMDGDDDEALESAVEVARGMAAARGLERIYVLDRTASPIAQAAVQHEGDRTTAMDRLQDTDPEDGMRGVDMRDRHPS